MGRGVATLRESVRCGVAGMARLRPVVQRIIADWAVIREKLAPDAQGHLRRQVVPKAVNSNRPVLGKPRLRIPGSQEDPTVMPARRGRTHSGKYPGSIPVPRTAGPKPPHAAPIPLRKGESSRVPFLNPGMLDPWLWFRGDRHDQGDYRSSAVAEVQCWIDRRHESAFVVPVSRSCPV